MSTNVVIIGEVAQGLETREFQKDDNKVKVGRFSVAMPARQEGETIYYQVESWNEKQLNFLRDNLKKGELIAVKGNLVLENYTNKDGKQGRAFRIENPEVSLLGSSNSKNGITSISATGRLTKDVEINTTSTGKKVTTITVASSDPLKKDSEGNPHTNFLDIECWEEQAENMAKYLAKGSLVSVTGSIAGDVFKTKNDDVGRTIKIVNAKIDFLERKRDSSESSSDATIAKQNQKQSSAGK